MSFNTSKFRFILNALSGEGGFANGEYLDKFPRESEVKFNKRKEGAYHVNLFHSKVKRYVGYLFKQKALRAYKSNTFIDLVINNIDNKGNSIDIFMQNFSFKTKAIGCNLVLVDMPTNLGGNLKEQIKNRALPYLYEITPDKVVSFKTNITGEFEFIAFRDVIDNSVYGVENKIPIIRYFDKEKWVLFDGETEIKRGEHNLGVCPIVALSEANIFPFFGEFSQMANIEKRLYNLRSELDEILRNQTFSLLTINASEPSDVELKLSSENAIVYGDGLNAPSFIAPNTDSAKIYQEEIKNLEDNISKIAYDTQTHQNNESGIALQIKFQGLNSSLNSFANHLEQFENKIFKIINLYLNDVGSAVDVTYPKDFNLVDVENEIKILDDIKTLGYSLPIYEATKLKQIISSDLNTKLDEDLEKEINEIEQSAI